jgi:trigger factor
VFEFFRQNPRAADSLRGPIFEEKVIDFILDSAKVEEKSATPEELVAEPSPAVPEPAPAGSESQTGQSQPQD